MAAVFVMCLGLAACGGQPYVHIPDEFNRGSEDFGKDITDRADVTICYSADDTTPDVVRKLAVDECARFGKVAKFVDQNYSACPLLTPVSAHYECEEKPSKQGYGYYQY